MKPTFLSLALTLILIAAPAVGQGVADPLLWQGMERFVVPGARGMAMGGGIIATGSDATALFTNPAAMSFFSSPEVRIGGRYQGQKFSQHQQWIPNELYAELSLLFENKTPVRLRAFDNITPDWSKNLSSTRPSMAAVVMPFQFADWKLAAGVGFMQAIDLTHYFQNNNALSPNIGQMRPAPIPRPRTNDTVFVEWFQFITDRTGKVNAFAPSLAVGIGENFSLGLTVNVLNGSSNDNELRHDRGFLKLTTQPNSSSSFNRIILDSVVHDRSMTGTSEYKGASATLGAQYKVRYFSAAAVVKPGYTITRSWSRTIRTTTSSGTSVTTESGEDKLHLPVQVSLGLALFPAERWTIGIDYDVRSYDEVRYTSAAGIESKPWVNSSIFRVGAEYRALDWLSIRGGVGENAQVIAPAGSGLPTEPSRGTSYTGGFGLTFGPLMFDAAYEYAQLKFQDTWLSNVNYNKREGHTLVFEAAYRF